VKPLFDIVLILVPLQVLRRRGQWPFSRSGRRGRNSRHGRLHEGISDGRAYKFDERAPRLVLAHPYYKPIFPEKWVYGSPVALGSTALATNTWGDSQTRGRQRRVVISR
jgi:hypothetical protein